MSYYILPYNYIFRTHVRLKKEIHRKTVKQIGEQFQWLIIFKLQCVSCSHFFFRVPKFARQYSRAFKCWSLFWNQNHFGNVKSLLSWSFIFGTHKIEKKKWHLIYFSWPSLLSARPSQTITRRIKIKAVFINWALTSCQVLWCVFHFISS